MKLSFKHIALIALLAAAVTAAMLLLIFCVMLILQRRLGTDYYVLFGAIYWIVFFCIGLRAAKE